MKQLLSDYKFWVITILYAITIGGMFANNSAIYKRLDAIENAIESKLDIKEYESRQTEIKANFNEVRDEMKVQFNDLKLEVKTNLAVVAKQYAEIQRFMGFVEARLEGLKQSMTSANPHQNERGE